ncbi:hypothetical protein [Novosphingobium resinovorum]|uniref:hypothetical protein n=1 Tax=Novosphingobium resinovorum TaxID=158500 RepID=UPI002ED44C23|nr:hypothetical protein [Novosphingobium resinovorum]
MKRAALVVVAAAAAASALLSQFGEGWRQAGRVEARATGRVPETTVGINLFGPQTYNRQQVFANLIAQSEWFQSRGSGWTPMPADRLDAAGWVLRLDPGQTAPRPLVLPDAPFRPAFVRCTFLGSGEITAGGVARVIGQGAHSIDLRLTPLGAEDEGAWIELVRTDPVDPVRAIDCRKAGTPAGVRFDPDFLRFAADFGVIRFMDWQRVNDNPRIAWNARARPQQASQVGAGGVSAEDMVDLANAVHADPWFVMPYHADEAYLRGFARLVHDRLDPDARVYVEFGNEIWNDGFAAARDARAEGLARGLGEGDPIRAGMERYAERMTAAMRVWTQVFADRPGALIRVCATQHANPELARVVLGFRDSAEWVDALATAPYIWLDLAGYRSTDADRVFAALPGAVDRTLDMAAENRAIAIAHGKRYIAYEGGQHLVTPDIDLARAVQRDPRMARAYTRYLTGWRDRFGDTLTLYASTAPIAWYGSWGLREYAGQPLAEAPKYDALRRFLEARP